MFRNVLTPSAAAPGSIDAALADAAPRPFWLDDPGKPYPEPALTGAETCDLLVVGGGYSGLWTALLAKERDPSRDVVLEYMQAEGTALGDGAAIETLGCGERHLARQTADGDREASPVGDDEEIN